MINFLIDANELSTQCFVCGGQELPYQLSVFAHACINLVKILVPVLLILFGVFDMFKAMTSQKEDEMKKAQNVFIKRLISAALVFFVIVIVQFVFGTLSNLGFGGSFTECLDTFVNGGATKITCSV